MEKKEFLPLLLVVIDASEASVGITNGERIEVLWSDTSFVPRKHNAGGQSKERFARGREEALKHWLRKVRDVIIKYHDNRNLIIGGPGMTKDKFIKELPGYISNKISRIENCGYTSDSGLWEVMNLLRIE